MLRLSFGVLRDIKADDGIYDVLHWRECVFRILSEDEFHADGVADWGTVGRLQGIDGVYDARGDDD